MYRKALWAACGLLSLALTALGGLGVMLAHAAADRGLRYICWLAVLIGGFTLLYSVRKGGEKE